MSSHEAAAASAAATAPLQAPPAPVARADLAVPVKARDQAARVTLVYPMAARPVALLPLGAIAHPLIRVPVSPQAPTAPVDKPVPVVPAPQAVLVASAAVASVPPAQVQVVPAAPAVHGGP